MPTRPDADQWLKGSDSDNVVMMLHPANWRAPLLTYILEEVLPLERMEARKISHHAKTFIAIGDELDKRSPSEVLMKCIPTDQGK